MNVLPVRPASSFSGTSIAARSVVTGEMRPSGVAATAVKRSAPFARPPCGTSVRFSNGTVNSSGRSHILPDFFGTPTWSEARRGFVVRGMCTCERTVSEIFSSGVRSTTALRERTRRAGALHVTLIARGSPGFEGGLS